MIESKTGSRLRANPSTSTKALWSTKTSVRGSSTASEDVFFLLSFYGTKNLEKSRIKLKQGGGIYSKIFGVLMLGMNEMGWNCMFIHRSFIIR
ncbi:hypothetical protein Peur_017341 [Populus x canadensis]